MSHQDHFELALNKACEHLWNITGSCPIDCLSEDQLDMFNWGNCSKPGDEGGCFYGAEIGCWKHFRVRDSY
jgi:hypothetical protein